VKVLDTSICVPVLNGSDRVLAKRVRAEAGDLSLCSVVKAELLYGAHHSSRPSENLARLADFFSLFPSVPFDDEAAEQYGLLRAHLRRVGSPIGPNDLLIAASAVAFGASLVTRNASEFSRVPGLEVEVW
jgi:tRNA(fMet)-specific endonuclease VapC